MYSGAREATIFLHRLSRSGNITRIHTFRICRIHRSDVARIFLVVNTILTVDESVEGFRSERIGLGKDFCGVYFEVGCAGAGFYQMYSIWLEGERRKDVTAGFGAFEAYMNCDVSKGLQ